MQWYCCPAEMLSEQREGSAWEEMSWAETSLDGPRDKIHPSSNLLYYFTYNKNPIPLLVFNTPIFEL